MRPKKIGNYMHAPVKPVITRGALTLAIYDFSELLDAAADSGLLTNMSPVTGKLAELAKHVDAVAAEFVKWLPCPVEPAAVADNAAAVSPKLSKTKAAEMARQCTETPPGPMRDIEEGVFRVHPLAKHLPIIRRLIRTTIIILHADPSRSGAELVAAVKAECKVVYGDSLGGTILIGVIISVISQTVTEWILNWMRKHGYLNDPDKAIEALTCLYQSSLGYPTGPIPCET